jgi:hypothetical protein
MKFIISLNQEAHDFKDKQITYGSSASLIKEFVLRGHNVYTILTNKTEENSKTNQVFAPHYLHTIEGFEYSGTFPISGDLFFVRSLCEDHPSNSLGFMNHLSKIEKQVGLMVNTSLSTSYENKKEQKKLDLPFIPSFEVNSKKDLENLLNFEQIIAKPLLGAMGSGVKYLEGITSSDLIPEEDLGSYCFERYIPANIEERFIFLDGEIVVRRGMERHGKPGAEEMGDVWLLNEDTSKKEEIVRATIDQTKMFYGCVDFRGDYILEINGSGTATGPINAQGIQIYNLVPKIVDKVEKILRG